MTFGEAAEQVRRAARATREAVESARVEVLDSAAAEVARVWPRDTGESAEGWERAGGALVNDVPHTSYVHDGLADRLVPQVLRDHEDEFRTAVERRIDSAAGW